MGGNIAFLKLALFKKVHDVITNSVEYGKGNFEVLKKSDLLIEKYPYAYRFE